MDKQKRREFKNQFKEIQKERDAQKLEAMKQNPIFRESVLMREQIENWRNEVDNITEIITDLISKWSDDELENKILYYVNKQIQKKKYALRRQFKEEMEKEILASQNSINQLFYPVMLFEDSISLNASCWDYFYQNAALLAVETLNSYLAMGNLQLAEFVEQGMGAYLKLQLAGEIAPIYGIIHRWDIDNESIISKNKYTFEELDEILKQIDLRKLRTQRIEYIRNINK